MSFRFAGGQCVFELALLMYDPKYGLPVSYAEMTLAHRAAVENEWVEHMAPALLRQPACPRSRQAARSGRRD